MLPTCGGSVEDKHHHQVWLVERALPIPAAIRHEQREGDVLVTVARGPAAAHLAVGAHLPVHTAVPIQVMAVYCHSGSKALWSSL